MARRTALCAALALVSWMGPQAAHARPPEPPAGPKLGSPAAPGAAELPATPAGSPVTAMSSPGQAAPVRAPPEAVTGIEREATGAEPIRGVVSDLLSPLRTAVEFVFYAGEGIAGLIDNQQIVPRVSDILSGRRGGIFVFPTAFAETAQKPSIGARMIAAGGGVATSLRAGYGGTDTAVVEGRLRYTLRSPAPIALSLESFFDIRTGREFLGVGQDPATDSRNAFRSAFDTGYYRQRRARAIASIGVRPSDDIELFLSTSLLHTRVDDDDDAGPLALSRVFEPSSTVGAFTPITLAYTEVAVRLDTRIFRGLPSAGYLIEAYAGPAYGIDHGASEFLRAGGRAAAFFPIVRSTNILSPAVQLDGLAALGSVPFFELPDEHEFRGFNTRRDNVSFVTSVEYWWIFAAPFAARLFTDASVVGPSVAKLPFERFRWATGLGLSVASSTAELARLNFAFSPEGVRVLLSIGVDRGFGDRQHRD